MAIRLYLFIFLCSLGSVACAEKSEVMREEKPLMEQFVPSKSVLEQSTFKLIPNTKWQYVNLENLIIYVILKSENEFSVNDSIGARSAGLLLHSQVNIGSGYASVVFISKMGPKSCNYIENNNCIVSIQFSEMNEEVFPAKIINNGIRSEVYIFDDEFLDKLQESEELVVNLPISLGRVEKIIFDVAGFKPKFLEFK